MEKSPYPQLKEWQGFENFVVRFLIRMSQDFASRSLIIKDESMKKEGFSRPVIDQKRSWEKSFHPYLFFNPDDTLSFCGFVFDHTQNSWSIKDETTGDSIGINIEGQLFDQLRLQFSKDREVRFNASLNSLSRAEKLTILCRVFGVKKPPAEFEEQ